MITTGGNGHKPCSLSTHTTTEAKKSQTKLALPQGESLKQDDADPLISSHIGAACSFILPDSPRKGKANMKLPTPRKLPSGSWYARIQVDGKMVNVTRPTKKEVEQELMALKSKAKEAPAAANLTVAQAIDAYIAAREGVDSPATIKGYKAIQKNRFQKTMGRKIASITQEQWQTIIGLEAKEVSAKTVKNAWGLVSSAITEATGKQIKVKLPQVVKKEAKYISSSDLKKFLSAIQGHWAEIPILLALHSLRRSEIMNVRWEDIDLENNCIHVQGAAVYDSNNHLVHKETNKNTSSQRTIPFILPQLRQAVESSSREGEYAVTCYPNSINVVVQRICKGIGIPTCTTHGLRKTFASMMLVDLKQPEAIVMQIGGWSDPQTMRKIYTQVSTENTQKAGAQFSTFIQNLL